MRIDGGSHNFYAIDINSIHKEAVNNQRLDLSKNVTFCSPGETKGRMRLNTALKTNLFDEIIRKIGYNGPIKVNGKGQRTFTTHCPKHKDTNPSLSVTDFGDTIGLYCFAGCHFEDILEEWQLKNNENSNSHRKKLIALSIEKFAQEKGLTVEELKSFGVEQKKYKGFNAVWFPYYLQDGSRSKRSRIRLKNNEDEKVTLWYGKGEPIIPYGLNKLQKAKEKKYLFLVEGETDTITMSIHGFPTLGIPGASFANVIQSEHVKSINSIYIMDEKDKGAKTFLSDIPRRLKSIGWQGDLYKISMPDNIKDPNELYKRTKKREEFIRKIEEIRKNAIPIKEKNEQQIPTVQIQKKIGDAFDDLPNELKNLKIPKNWTLDDRGVGTFKKINADEWEWIQVARSPLFISRYIDRKNNELSKVEIMFKYRGSWTTLLATRSEIANQTQITKLADRKLPITSVGAKQIVAFLDAFEAENEDLIPHKESVDHLGWSDKSYKIFVSNPKKSPYFLDLMPSLRDIAEGFHSKGTLEKWIEGIKPYIAVADQKPIFPIARAVISSYFASPLLELLQQRSFVIHLFSNSGGGKTATNYLGASVWGHPEELKIMLDSTRFSIESRAGLYRHLPLFTDELQSINKRRQTETAEQLLYMISNNRGRERGNRDGGLREPKKWRLIMNTTGERPLTEDNSQGGAKNRALEIYGKPIHDTHLAKKAYRIACRNYGTAGPYFINKVIELGKETIQKYYDSIHEMIDNYAIETGNSPQHIMMVSSISLADFLANQWLFKKTEDEAILETYNLAVLLLESLENSHNIDDSERAKEFMESWFFMNREKHFTTDTIFTDDPWGWVSAKEKEICILPIVFENALKEAGFNPTRTLKDWREKKWIKTKGQRYKVRRKHPSTGDEVTVIAIRSEILTNMPNRKR